MKNKLYRNILILGASSDIGLSLLNILPKDKYFIYAHCARNEKKLKEFISENKNFKIIKLNFKNLNNNNLDSYIKKNFNEKFDIIVNLIGYIDNKSFYNTNMSHIDKALKINSIIPLLIIQKSILHMEKNKFGRILNCSSIGVKFGGGSNNFNYSLSKHLLEFIPSSYKDWAKKNVLINNLRIGVTNTKIHKKINNKNILKRTQLIPLGRMAEPIEISKFINFLISENNTYITGETLSISGGE